MRKIVFRRGGLGRRRFLAGGAALGGGLLVGAKPQLAFGQAPAIAVSDKMRPQALQGVMSGDVTASQAVIWCRADRPSRMIVEYATGESFADARRVLGSQATEATDFTTRAILLDLPAGQELLYRVTYLDLGDLKTTSTPVAGRLRTAPAGRRDIVFQWSGDTAGQGWGINPEWGGMKIYETMRRTQPDFFIHNGDNIYADGPIQAEVKLADGSVWKNITTPEKSKVAETLDEFRGAYRYNLMDANLRRFNAEVPQIWQWDDHEVMNNWSPGKDISADPRYTEKRVPVIASRAARAFLDYAPMRPSNEEVERVYRHIPYGPSLDIFVIDMRSYRAANGWNRQTAPGDQTAYMGRAQIRWLKQALLASNATWKVVAADMPLGLMVEDGKDAQGRVKFENSSNGDGPVLGREFEIAELLSAIKHNAVKNVVWLTADVHYAAAHYYDPAKAQFTDFDPFWEFVTGPLHAGTFGPNKLDNTFGPQVVFQKAPGDGQQNLPPTAGMQFYGEIKIDGRDEAMNVALKDLAGATLWQKTLAPERA